MARSYPSIEDYSHWNEEAPIVKAIEDRYADYYADDEPDYDDYLDAGWEKEEEGEEHEEGCECLCCLKLCKDKTCCWWIL
jgi:hypothetical protein